MKNCRELQTEEPPFVLAVTLKRPAKASYFETFISIIPSIALWRSKFKIPFQTNLYTGYFEDRRPASNMDPYVVTSMIAETTILWKP